MLASANIGRCYWERSHGRARPEMLRASRAAHETQSGDGPSPSESATGHQAMRDGNQVPSSTQTSLDFLV